MNLKKFAINNVIRNIKSYLGYFFSISMSAALLFSFIMFMNHPNLDRTEFPSYLQEGLKISESIAYVFLFLFVFYSVSVFLKSRYKEFGILYNLGISKKQLKKMIFIENIIINAVSSVLGVIVGLVFSKIFLLVVSKLLELEPLKFYIPVKAIGSTIIYFIILAILISVFTSLVIKEDEVLKLLKGAKAPKPEPKTSPILAFLCFGLIALGYYQAVTVTEENILVRMVTVTLMIIIATYLLFSQLSVVSIKRIKKQRSLYMKKTNLLLISNLFYKIKDNTRIFFLITITSAVAFTSIGSVYAYWKDLIHQVDLAYPQDIYYSSNKQNDINNRNEEQVVFLEDYLKGEKVKYSKIDGEFKTVVSKDDNLSVQLIKESKYIELAKNLGIETIKLEFDEAISLTLIENRKVSGNLNIKDLNLKVIKQVDKGIMPAFYRNMYVVKDETYNNITSNFILDKFTTFNVNNYNDTLKICKEFEKIFNNNSQNKSYLFLSKAVVIETGKLIFSTVLFLAIFIGSIFFVTTSSFLYNKFYMDCQEDKSKYKQLNKIGLTYKEIKKIATIEIGILFLLPYLVAVIHSIFALIALKNLFNIKVTSTAFLVMGSFLMIQTIYFFFIRSNYLKEIKKNLIDQY